MSDTRCVLADIGIAVQNNGHLTICNQSRQLLCDHDGNTLRLDQHTIEQAWASPTRQKIKQDLDSGIINDNCRQCFQEEAAGVESSRLNFNQRFQNIVPREDQPLAFFLKPGNTCNLACRHCSPWVSSRWYRDYYETSVDRSVTTFNEWVVQFRGQRDSYSEENPLWQTFEQWSRDAVWFDIYGAEPMLVKTMTGALAKVAKSGLAKNKSMHINTNGTEIDENLLDVLPEFQHVSLEVSADGVGDQFEYMRYPASWESFSENLSLLKRFQQKHKESIDLHMTCTLSLYNIWNAAKTKNVFESEFGIPVGFNFVHYPDYMDLRNVPKEHKTRIRDHLVNSGIQHSPLRLGINDTVINFLMDELPEEICHSNIKKFLDVTDRVDRYRGQSFEKTFPEMYEILSQYR